MHVFLNGQLVPAANASISVFDRGFLMGDGVYEGLRSFGGRVHSLGHHIRRFRDGLREARIDWDPSQMEAQTARLLEVNGLDDAFIYWQITRGIPGPGQPVRTRIPAGPLTPTVLGFCAAQPSLDSYTAPPTAQCVTVQDLRWHRGRLKSTSLLGNVLSAMEAGDHGCREAIMVRDGLVTEACACNVILAVPTTGGRTQLVTPSLDSVPILAGVTRARVLELHPEIVQRAVTAQELGQAREVILVGTTALVTSVTHMDGRAVGDARPGPQATRLLESFVGAIRQEVGLQRPQVAAHAGAA